MLIAAVAGLLLAPSAEAEALGRRLAATGPLETLLPAIATRETEELIAQRPELSDADKKILRETGREVAARAGARLEEAMGHEYAAALSIEDLRALVAFAATPAAARYRAAMPEATARGLAKLGSVDFKADLAAAFCAKTGKLCRH